MLTSILIVTDNYWIGGRETFVADNVALLRENGLLKATLIAASVNNHSVDEVFDAWVHRKANDNEPSDSFLARCDHLINRHKPQLIWVQHFNLGLGLLLAARHQLPIHLTLHGPLSNGGQLPKIDQQALDHSMRNGATYSCVSAELARSLSTQLPQASYAGLLHNKVRVPADSQANKNPSSEPRKLSLLILSRQEKLQHLRQALRFTSAAKRIGLDVNLNIYTGHTSDQDASSSDGLSFSQLFGRKWLLSHPACLALIKRVNIYPPCLQVNEVIRQHDAVLGMGRVVLEALANGKPAVLIGYQQIIDVIDLENFNALQDSNFSGRAQAAQPIVQVVEKFRDQLRQTDKTLTQRQQLKHLVDIAASHGQLQQVLSASQRPFVDSGIDADLLALLHENI